MKISCELLKKFEMAFFQAKGATKNSWNAANNKAKLTFFKTKNMSAKTSTTMLVIYGGCAPNYNNLICN